MSRVWVWVAVAGFVGLQVFFASVLRREWPSEELAAREQAASEQSVSEASVPVVAPEQRLIQIGWRAAAAARVSSGHAGRGVMLWQELAADRLSARGYALTAGHVVIDTTRSYQVQAHESVVSGLSSESTDRQDWTIHQVWQHPELDVAVLELLMTRESPTQQEIASLPMLQPAVLVPDTVVELLETQADETGQLSRVQLPDPELLERSAHADWIQTMLWSPGLVVEPGMSGSPVWSLGSELLGLVIADVGGAAVILPLSELQEWWS